MHDKVHGRFLKASFLSLEKHLSYFGISLPTEQIYVIL